MLHIRSRINSEVQSLNLDDVLGLLGTTLCDSIDDIMEYILSGKFDPTNEIHTNELGKAQKVNSN